MNLLVISHACVAPLNQQLYSRIKKLAGWNVSIVVPSNWRDEYGRDCQANVWPSFDGTLIPIPVRRAGNIILHTYRTSFARLIRQIDPDAIYVHHEPYAAATAQVYWANATCGRKRPIGFYSAQNIVKKYPPPFRWTEKWILRSSAFAFPVSSTVDEVLRRKKYRGPSTVLPLAIDPDVYRPGDNDEAARRELLGDAGDDTLIGYVGRFVPEKGLATLLKALGNLRDLRWRLALIGAGPMENELRQLAQEEQIADRVTFTGFIPHVQVPRLLSALDLLVLPSETQPNWREQFGRVILEAMACGTPVIGSDSGEIGNLINDTGGGVIFRERDPAHLAEQLREMISDPARRQSLSLQGARRVKEKYTVDSVAEQFIATVQSVQFNHLPTPTVSPALTTSSIT